MNHETPMNRSDNSTLWQFLFLTLLVVLPIVVAVAVGISHRIDKKDISMQDRCRAYTIVVKGHDYLVVLFDDKDNPNILHDPECHFCKKKNQ
jgi:hypothetical protein